jgi:hypothetical protein
LPSLCTHSLCSCLETSTKHTCLSFQRCAAGMDTCWSVSEFKYLSDYLRKWVNGLGLFQSWCNAHEDLEIPRRCICWCSTFHHHRSYPLEIRY